ncbi:MAG: Origin recognition complex subunit 2 [Heterodermia speciosa]|uniref:Origin recognition complex subunit 2 n=1 Tax=Heterodermia speciosa TaxID=116794 RepID=A0A8H3FDH8_9LECA|nr:MAG: Origin recognition complex subunit 2 [Heterodermia speciosa]
MTGKRKRQEGDGLPNGIEEQSKQKRTRQESPLVQNHANNDGEREEIPTPSKPRRGRPPGSGKKTKATANGFQERANQGTSPSKSNGKGKLLFVTPRKSHTEDHDDERMPVPITRNADHSARRKSARRLIERTITDLPSEEEELDEGATLARKIWNAEDFSDDGSGASQHHEDPEEEAGYTTPSKRGPNQRKRARRKKSLTPPQDLAPHEEYFFQNRLSRIKSSSHTLSSLPLLTHEQYHNELSKYKDSHASSLRFLQSLHSRSFPQWNFELAQSFNICLYGYGSKRRLVTAFADYLHSLTPSAPPLVLMVNGYTPTLTLRQILILIASQVSKIMPLKLPSQPVEAVTTLITYLVSHPPETPVNLFVNSLDAPPLRRAPIPTLLAQLAASPHIRLLATCDQPNFPLLWDTSLLEQYNWIYHDTTTFVPYGGVEVPVVIDEVNELLGRSGRTVKGKEGVGFVLRSLPENARNLYRVLIAELLAADAEGDEAAARASDFEDDVDVTRAAQGKKGGEAGIDYRVLYQKVVEEFICSNEMAFRQLLKEFHDHQMVVSRKDGMGGELLGVPFMREEMEGILEDMIV